MIGGERKRPLSQSVRRAYFEWCPKKVRQRLLGFAAFDVLGRVVRAEALIDGVGDFAGEVRRHNNRLTSSEAVAEQRAGLFGKDLGRDYPLDGNAGVDGERSGVHSSCLERSSRASRIIGHDSSSSLPPRRARIRSPNLREASSASSPRRTSSSVSGLISKSVDGTSNADRAGRGAVGVITWAMSPRRIRTALGPTRTPARRPTSPAAA